MKTTPLDSLDQEEEEEEAKMGKNVKLRTIEDVQIKCRIFSIQHEISIIRSIQRITKAVLNEPKCGL